MFSFSISTELRSLKCITNPTKFSGIFFLRISFKNGLDLDLKISDSVNISVYKFISKLGSNSGFSIALIQYYY